MKQIKKAAVIGAGVMGSGIAAQLANAGIEVELLDQKDVAQKALDKMAKGPASPLMHKKNAKLIRAGNAGTDLERVKDCDIIIEAIIEDPAVKSDLFKKVDALRKEGSIVASNTSTLPLVTLTEGQSEQFKKDFVITHFFNPPRQMPLVEIVTSAANSPETVKAVTVTAATSSPLTDGASAVLVVSEEFAKEHGLTILARIKSFAISGCDPDIMGMGPVESMNKAMAKAGITADDIDILEINEAFAVQAKACIDQLGIPVEKVNKDGGAIAIGHPLGASGARITGKAAQLLHKEGARYAASTMCIGGGQGIATILENPANDNNPAPPKVAPKPKATFCPPAPKG